MSTRQQGTQLSRAQAELQEQSHFLGVQQTSKLDIISQEVHHLSSMITELRGQVAEAGRQKSAEEKKLDELVTEKVEDLKNLKLQSNPGKKSERNQRLPDAQMEDITTQIDDPLSAEWSQVDPNKTPQIEQRKSAPRRLLLSPEQIQSVLDSLTKTITAEAEVRKEISILSSLCFPSQPARRAAIPEAHRQTFSWIYKSKFAEWLTTKEDGIFWITGKAGSGKSTLMKFLSDNRQTVKLAKESALPNRAVIASHFFWSPGTEMQKSQQGLFQTLLFDICRQCPFMIPTIVPQRWDSHIDGKDQLPWSVPELSEALREIRLLENCPVQFYLFIDGLDEYAGDHYELCQTLGSLSRCPSMHLCVSSRPWNVFEEYFGKNPLKRIAIHEETKADIRHFAKGRLEGHPRWTEWSLEGNGKENLLDEIVYRAEGVFLWAFLVTNSLMEGITNEDTVDELKERLESLPTDLERLFKHMLDGVEPMYYSNMAGILRMALQATGALSWEIYRFYDYEENSPNYTISMTAHPTSMEERDRHLQRTKKRINARTKGLLELTYSRVVSNHRVEFLHRTVRDFLSTGEMSDYLCSKSKPEFEPCLSISKGYLALIKSTDFYKGWGDVVGQSVEDLIRQCLRYAIQVPMKHVLIVDEIIDDLESTVVEFSTRPVPVLSYRHHMNAREFFQAIAEQERADGYLGRNLSRDWQYLSATETLSLAMITESETQRQPWLKSSWLGNLVEEVTSNLKSHR